jgi:hypothetical protein
MSGSRQKPWLEYRLERLAFWNGAELGFRNARMLYRDDSREIVIDRLGAPPALVDKTVREVMGAQSPIKTIFYEMRVHGYPRVAFFYHPIPRSVRVMLEPRPNGQNVLYFSQKNGDPIFSKDWTLREVTGGKIPIDQAVWQFHGAGHEH